MQSPNILLIVSDQHRLDAAGCYGNNEVKTPNLDRMASEGLKFTRAVSHSPVCAPFRASLQTGKYVNQHGVGTNESTISDWDQRCFADWFNDAGYETCFIGKVHWSADLHNLEPGDRRRLGWKHWWGGTSGCFFEAPYFPDGRPNPDDEKTPYEPEVQTDIAIRFMTEHADKPWMMQLHFHPPHNDNLSLNEETVAKARKLNEELGLGLDEEQFSNALSFTQSVPHYLMHEVVEQRFLDMYDADKLTPPKERLDRWSEKLVQLHLKEYYAQTTAMDEQIGRILEHLRAQTGRPTIVIYTTDHGDRMGTFDERSLRGKCEYRQSGFRIPFIAWGEGVPAGETTEALVNTVDLLPTCAELAGIHDGEVADRPGVSIARHIQGGSAPERDFVYVGCGYYAWRGIFTGERFYGWTCSKNPPMEVLIDTVTDPDDQVNLATDPTWRDERDELCETLFHYMDEIGDTEMVAEFRRGAAAR